MSYTNYWLFAPAITDSVNKYSVFGGHFNPKSPASRTCERQFKFHCCHLVTTSNISHSKHLHDEQPVRGKSIRNKSVLRHTSQGYGWVKVRVGCRPLVTFVFKIIRPLFFNPRCQSRGWFLVWNSEWKSCERLLPR